MRLPNQLGPATEVPSPFSMATPGASGEASRTGAVSTIATSHELQRRSGGPLDAQMRPRIPLPRATNEEWLEQAIAAMRPQSTAPAAAIWQRLLGRTVTTPQQVAATLTSGQRTQLELELENNMRMLPMVQAADACGMWLAVQQARLHRYTSPPQTDSRRDPYQDALRALQPGDSAHPRWPQYERPEYHDAINGMLRVIGDDTVSPVLRDQVSRCLTRYWHVEGGLSRMDAAMFGIRGVEALARQGYRSGGPAFEVLRDIEMQRRSLGEEMREVMARSGRPLTPIALSFNEEPNARSFARVLARVAGTTGGDAAAEVVDAIVQDPDLRQLVFGMAEAALGSCGDNVAEGWSRIVTQVRTHRIAQRLRSGEISEPDLHGWGRQQFRLATLEALVHTAMAQWLRSPALSANQRQKIASEALETMLHAKSALKAELDLPPEVSSTMSHGSYSVLDAATLIWLADEVRRQEADSAKLAEYLLCNQNWTAGMRQLHDAQFQELRQRFDDDPFYDLPLPAEGPGLVEQQVAYAEKAADFKRRIEESERDLLRRLLAEVQGGG